MLVPCARAFYILTAIAQLPCTGFVPAYTTTGLFILILSPVVFTGDLPSRDQFTAAGFPVPRLLSVLIPTSRFGISE